MTMVEVSGLIDPRMLVEIEAVAIRGAFISRPSG
jgi:enamine deaminase RidA (YjgF/YER057c/UK114 family)